MTPSDRGRRLIAERTGWPDGAAAQCERVERQHPGIVAWMPANNVKDFERREGYYAWREGDEPLRNGVRRHELYAPSASELAKRLG
jgi:hypothetical protein